MPIAEKEIESIASHETEFFVVEDDRTRPVEMELSDDARQWIPGRIGLNDKLNVTVAGNNAEFVKQQTEPVAGQGIVVLRPDDVDCGVVIGAGAGGKIGAEQQTIAWRKQRRQTRQDLFGTKVGNDTETGQEPLGAVRCQPGQVPGQIGSGGQITNHRMTTVDGKQPCQAIVSDQDKRNADVNGNQRHAIGGVGQAFDKPTFLFRGAATKRDNLDGARSEMLGHVMKRPQVGFPAIPIATGRGMSFVKALPCAGLFAGFVKELWIDPTETDRFDQVRPCPIRELAWMDVDMDEAVGHGRGCGWCDRLFRIPLRVSIWRGPCL